MSNIIDINEPWNGHSYSEVESFLKSEIGTLDSVAMGEQAGVNLLNPDTITPGKIVRRDNGRLLTTSAGKCTDFIPIPDIGLICNHTLANAGVANCGAVIFNKDKEYVGFVNPVYGIDGYPTIVKPDGNDSWKYVRFNLPAEVYDGYGVYVGDVLPAEFIAYAPPTPRLKVITPQDTSFFKKTSATRNLVDPSRVASGYYIVGDNGRLKYGGNLYRCTGYIPVSLLGLFCNHPLFRAGVSGVIGCAVYNPDYSFKRRLNKQYVFESGDDGCYVRYSFFAEYEQIIQVEEGDVATEYVAYEPGAVLDECFLPTTSLSPEDVSVIKSILTLEKIYSRDIEICLPECFYAVRGDTLQLFYQGMVRAFDISGLNVMISCPVGTQYARYYEFKCPTDAEPGQYTFKVTVKDDNRKVLAEKSCLLKVVDAPSSPAEPTNILCLGDSLSANGIWPCEFNRRLTGLNGSPVGDHLQNINFLGSMSKERDGITTHFEGHSGYGWKDYAEGRQPRFRFYLMDSTEVNIGDVYRQGNYNYLVTEINVIDGEKTILTSASSLSDLPSPEGELIKVSGGGDETIIYVNVTSETNNPFWDGAVNRLSFINYVENVCNLPAETKIDALYVILGANGINQPWEETVEYMKSFIDQLHEDYPNCKVKLLDMYFPSMKIMMPVYGANGRDWADTYGILFKLFELHNRYLEFSQSEETSGTSGDSYSSFVELVNTSAQVDTDYNQAQGERPVNSRNEEHTERYGNNGIHLSTDGYEQIADCVYRNFVAKFCQND